MGLTTKLVLFNSVESINLRGEVGTDELGTYIKIGEFGSTTSLLRVNDYTQEQYIQVLKDNGWMSASEDDMAFFVEPSIEQHAEEMKKYYKPVPEGVQYFIEDVWRMADKFIDEVMATRLEEVGIANIRAAKRLVAELAKVDEVDPISEWTHYKKAKWVDKIFAMVPLKDGKRIKELYDEFNIDNLEQLLEVLEFKITNISPVRSPWKMLKQIGGEMREVSPLQKMWTSTQNWIKETRSDIIISRLFEYKGRDYDRFDKHPPEKVGLKFHGTKPERIRSILGNMLRLPNNNGGMLGGGIYTTTHMSKAINYTGSFRRLETGIDERPILLVETNDDRQHVVQHHSKFTLSQLAMLGAQSVLYPKIPDGDPLGRNRSNGDEHVYYRVQDVRIVGIAMVYQKQ